MHKIVLGEILHMDLLKLCEKVMSYDEIKDIPVFYIYTIICCVIEAIGSGECFYETEFE